MRQSFWQIYALSTLAMGVLFLVSVWLMSIYGGTSHGAGLGLGAMAAFWGGPGFGLMLAGIVLGFVHDH